MKKIRIIMISLLVISLVSCAQREEEPSVQLTPSTKLLESTAITLDPMKDAIKTEGQITANEIGVSTNIVNIFENGSYIIAEDEDSVYTYQLQEDKHVEISQLTKNRTSMEKDYIYYNNGIQYATIEVPNANKAFVTVINSNANRAIVKMYFPDNTETKFYEIELSSGKLVDISYKDKLDEVDLNNRIEETCVALPENRTLCHYYIQKKTASESKSIWLIIDSNGEVSKMWETVYYDNLSNISVNEKGDKICFSYGQTPGRPQILDINSETVSTIFDESVFFGYGAVTFSAWVNSDTLAIGYIEGGETLIKFTKDV